MAHSVRFQRASDEEFFFDTGKFDEAARLCKSLSEKMAALRNEMDRMKNDLMFSWAGAGRNVFEKKYRILNQQCGDLSDSLRDIAESIFSMEQEYIQADMKLAKALDGIDSRY